jgi:hypothetical protein
MAGKNSGSDTQQQAAPELQALPQDIFDDIEGLRSVDDYAETGAVKAVLTDVPVGRPKDQTWFKIHPRLGLSMVLFRSQSDNEFYVVTPPMRRFFPTGLRFYQLYVGITSRGGLFIWPIQLPGNDGYLNRWPASAHEAARTAMQSWCRITSARDQGCYLCATPLNDLGPARWPDELSLTHILRLGFGTRKVETPDHPLVKQLRGESL